MSSALYGGISWHILLPLSFNVGKPMTNALRWNAPICRSYPYTEKVLPGACKSYLAIPCLVFKWPPLQIATERPTRPILEEFFKLSSKNNRNCSPLSTLSIHHDTACLHQQAFLPPMARISTQTHFPPRSHKNGMAQRHHLSKALYSC